MIGKESAINELKQRGIRPSYIRVKILNFLSEKRVHSTVDEIYEQLSKEVLTLSKTTVYNTLKLFVEHDLVRPLNIEGNEMRYETNRDFHAHFKCKECNEIIDIFMDKPNLSDELTGYTITEEQFLITGVCPSCKYQKSILG